MSLSEKEQAGSKPRLGRAPRHGTVERIEMIAYDLVLKEVVVITGETATEFRLSDGTWADKWDITRNVPQWALETYATQKAADFADERNTQEDALA